MKNYDLLIIGSGTAAMVAAMRMRAAKWSVAVMDFRPLGGTCALRGCDPKKMLVRGAETVDLARRMAPHGVDGKLVIDWPELMRFKRTFTDPVPGKRAASYAAAGVDVYQGRARFVEPNALKVGNETISGRHILIAVGAEPVRLHIPGEEHLVTNLEFLSLERLPPRIILVGGGYIAAEFSHIAARAGAHVTILQRGPRLLTPFDPDLVGLLMPKFAEIGIDVQTGTTVESVEKMGAGFRVQAQGPKGSVSIEGDLVVHASGRAPALADLDLEAGGIAHDKHKLKLNEFLQSTSNEAVYAAGDAAQMGPPLTPVSSHDAKIVAANLLDGPRQKPDYRGVPSVAFTIPPIAAVGLTEDSARSQGLKFQTHSASVPGWFTALQSAETVYGYKVLVEEGSGHLLGAHLVGPQVDEVINLFALAIRHDITAEGLKTMMFAYPTGGSDVGSMV